MFLLRPVIMETEGQTSWHPSFIDLHRTVMQLWIGMCTLRMCASNYLARQCLLLCWISTWKISNVQHKETVRGKSTFSFSTTLMGRLVQEFRRLCGVKGVGLKRSGKETEEKMGVNVEGRPGVNASYPVGKLWREWKRKENKKEKQS